jgi:ubiquinone/menaquinone biosynthesis C-methylase UbiE
VSCYVHGGCFIKKGVDKKRYDRIASFYDPLEIPMEFLFYARWRQEILKWVPKVGKILEIGVGTGKNLPYYYESNEIFGVDISGKMLKKAKKRATRAKALVHLVQTDVETLGFPDKIFDAVISTYVFCSVENPIQGLKEIKRVLRRTGNAIFLEHMRSENEFLGKTMDLFNPLVVNAFGPNINRRTVENIRNSGFKIITEKHLFSTIFRIIVASH